MRNCFIEAEYRRNTPSALNCRFFPECFSVPPLYILVSQLTRKSYNFLQGHFLFVEQLSSCFTDWHNYFKVVISVLLLAERKFINRQTISFVFYYGPFARCTAAPTSCKITSALKNAHTLHPGALYWVKKSPFSFVTLHFSAFNVYLFIEEMLVVIEEYIILFQIKWLQLSDSFK